MKKIIRVIALVLIGYTAIPGAYATIDYSMSSATGSGSGTTSTSSTSYSSTTSSSGTSYSSGSGYTSGYISSGSGYTGGSGSGCSYNCPVPEPESFFLMGVGLLGLYLARRRR